MDVRRMRPKPKTSPLDKKIVKNPRYKNVENVVDTGNNLRKELEKLEEVHQYYKFRNDEVFRRVNINNLVRLLIEQTKLEYQLNPPAREHNVEAELLFENKSEFNDSVADELDFDMNDLNIEAEAGEDVNDDIRSIIHSHYDPQSARGDSRRAETRPGRCVSSSVVNGIGEMDPDQVADTEPQERDSRPFVILDVRESEEYSRSHLVYSQSYHHTRLNRAFDYETREMLRVKNRPGHILVVCDNDESQASKFATTLTQRGYDNVFMLSGGLRVAQLKYPSGLVVASEEQAERLEEGDVLLLEQALEDNILEGEAAATTGRRLTRSSSLSSNRRFGDSAFRTSTALGAK